MKQYIIIFGCVVPMLLLFDSCTKNFEKYNTDPFGLNNGQLAVDFNNLGDPLKEAQLNLFNYTDWEYQVQQNLNADIFSGYFMSADPFNNNISNLTYSLYDPWNFYTWDYGYNNVMSPIAAVLKSTNAPEFAPFYQWAKILRVEGMHRVTDVYGPIIYTHYGESNSGGSATFDAQQDVYTAFFNDLDSAIDEYTQLVQSGEPSLIAKFDLIYGGDYSKWLKFANTLRLRLAIRISNVDPQKAKEEGEKSLNNADGLLETNDDNAFVDIGSNVHPINTISKSWGDISMGAPLLAYMNGYNDPRISKYALKATDKTVNGQYIGIRNGIKIDAIGRYAGYSLPVDFPNKFQIMVAAEAWFLKAEAAVRGWSNAGNAETDYNTGIQTSFQQYALDASSYINDAKSTEQEYIDPKAVTAGANDIKKGSAWLSTVTIKWDDGATMSEKIERIITQKWISMFPEGEEAWAEFRRTGYPILFPVVVNNSNGTISTTKFIQRLNFPSDERSSDPEGIQQATKLLGGPDNGGTPLWWAPK